MRVKTIISVIAAIMIMIVAVFGSMILFVRYDIRKSESLIRQIENEYPVIGIKDGIRGHVVKIYHPHYTITNDDPYGAYILLDDSIKLTLNTGLELESSYVLDKVLRLGDFIYKSAGNDLVNIYRISEKDTMKYKFKIKETIPSSSF